MDTAFLVLHPGESINLSIDSLTTSPWLSFPQLRLILHPVPVLRHWPPRWGWMTSLERSYSSELKNILLQSRKLSARMTYIAKWRSAILVVQQQLLPLATSVLMVLNYLLTLKQSGLCQFSQGTFSSDLRKSPSSAGLHGISHPSMERFFLKGFTHVFPPVYVAFLFLWPQLSCQLINGTQLPLYPWQPAFFTIYQ